MSTVEQAVGELLGAQSWAGIVDETVSAGAEALVGGAHDRLFFRPTVLAGVKPGMAAFEEEIFGHFGGVTRLELWTKRQWLTSREKAEPFPFQAGRKNKPLRLQVGRVR